MINVRAIANSAIQAINPNQSITWKQSTGNTVDAAGNQTPSYTTLTGIAANVQSLSWKDLQHKDLINVQGVKRAVYLYGNVQGNVRPTAKGGDLLLFPQELGGTVATWLVVCALETWNSDSTGWSKVAVVLQNP